MDIVPVFERLGEELSTAKEENITEEEYSPLVAEEGSSSTEIDLSTVATPDTYQLNLSVVVTETDSEEIESEFSDALTEIHGEKSFPCTLCDKLCKSKGGLTRHTNSKHSIVVQPDSSFCMDTLASMTENHEREIIWHRSKRQYKDCDLHSRFIQCCLPYIQNILCQEKPR